MQNKIKRRSSNAAIRHLYKILAQARTTTTANAQYEVSLPFSEADLLSELDVRGAHADELAPLSATEWSAYR